jgi:hypothetical protein
VADEVFALSENERRNPLWLKLREHLAQMLANKRGKNDDAALTENQTAKLRGEINLLKALVALGDEPPSDG